MSGQVAVMGQISDRDLMAVRRLFDEDFYKATYKDIEAACFADPTFDCAFHYATMGWREGRDPSANFQTARYLALNPHLEELGIVPLVHFYRENPEVIREKFITRFGRETYDSVLPHFDADYYFLKNPDVREMSAEDPDFDPLLHFMDTGWREGRDPSPKFSLSEYTELNPDVSEAGINPLLHYATQGFLEGRPTRLPGGFRTRYLSKLRSLDERIAAWRVGVPAPVTRDADLLAGIIGAAIVGAKRVAISFSHDNYSEIVGGVQLCLREEQRHFEETGAAYLNIHPVQPLPTIVRSSEAASYKLRMLRNGDFVATASADCVIDALAKGTAVVPEVELLVHSMHGHAPEIIERAAKLPNVCVRRIWIHDFLTVCPGYNLLRNDIAYCGAPTPESQACGICVYGADRSQHVARIEALFRSAPFEVVAPSESAKAIWLSSSNYPVEGVRVQPHRAFLEGSRLPRCGEDGSVRIAFVGLPSMHKGWNVFLGLLDRVYGLADHHFFAFGAKDPHDERVQWVEVTLNGSDNSGMIRAINENAIDYAVCWSICPETFSFTAHEALAGGAKVITNPDSGNIAALVAANDCGMIFADEDQLFDFVSAGELLRHARESRHKSAARAEEPSLIDRPSSIDEVI